MVLQDQFGIDCVIYFGFVSYVQYDLVLCQMGVGGMMVVIDFGSKDVVFVVMDWMGIFLILNNLGDVKFIVIYFVMIMYLWLMFEVQVELGIMFGLLWLLIGLEYVDDLIVDICQVL